MRRREFIGLLGSAAVWPLVARAQQPDRMRLIGVMVPGRVEDDPTVQRLISTFQQALQQLGWTEGRNVRFAYRWPGDDRDLIRKNARELVALGPDIILTSGTGGIGPLQQATRTVPIVFTSALDPVSAGLVESLARPGGSTTGFTNFDYSIAGKWLDLLRQVAPGIKRVAVLRDPTQFAGAGQLGAIQAAATAVGVELRPADVRDDKEIERAINAIGPTSNSGLIVQSSFAAGIHSKAIIALSKKYQVPAIYPARQDVVDGGLVAYAPDQADGYRRAAAYVDRILKGEKPGDLPVQNPTKYDLVINLKTAKALGLTVPPTMLTLADEVIE
jgi:putative ABC transport system substrate-binding protein